MNIGQTPLRLQGDLTELGREGQVEGNLCGEGAHRECLNKQNEGTIIIDQLLVSFV